MAEQENRDPGINMTREQLKFIVDTTSTLARIEQNLTNQLTLINTHIDEDRTALNRIHERLDNQGKVVSGINNDRNQIIGGKGMLAFLILASISLAGVIVAWIHK